MQETGVLETMDGARREVCYFLNKITEKLEIGNWKKGRGEVAKGIQKKHNGSYK